MPARLTPLPDTKEELPTVSDIQFCRNKSNTTPSHQSESAAHGPQVSDSSAMTRSVDSRHDDDATFSNDNDSGKSLHTCTSEIDRFMQMINSSPTDSSVATTSSQVLDREDKDYICQRLEIKLKSNYNRPPDEGPATCFLVFSSHPNHRVTLQLFENIVPMASQNFRTLCIQPPGQGYRQCSVHRIVPQYCIQMGDFINGDGTGGCSILKESEHVGKVDAWGNFIDETFVQHSNEGLLSMANNGPDRNGSQFFITLQPLPHLNGKHVVFGRVVNGMDVIRDISSIATDLQQRPLVETIRIVDCGQIVKGIDVRTEADLILALSTSSVASSCYACIPMLPSAFTVFESSAPPRVNEFTHPSLSFSLGTVATMASSLFGNDNQSAVLESKRSIALLGPPKSSAYGMNAREKSLGTSAFGTDIGKLISSSSSGSTHSSTAPSTASKSISEPWKLSKVTSEDSSAINTRQPSLIVGSNATNSSFGHAEREKEVVEKVDKSPSTVSESEAISGTDPPTKMSLSVIDHLETNKTFYSQRNLISLSSVASTATSEQIFSFPTDVLSSALMEEELNSKWLLKRQMSPVIPSILTGSDQANSPSEEENASCETSALFNPPTLPFSFSIASEATSRPLFAFSTEADSSTSIDENEDDDEWENGILNRKLNRYSNATPFTRVSGSSSRAFLKQDRQDFFAEATLPPEFDLSQTSVAGIVALNQETSSDLLKAVCLPSIRLRDESVSSPQHTTENPVGSSSMILSKFKLKSLTDVDKAIEAVDTLIEEDFYKSFPDTSEAPNLYSISYSASESRNSTRNTSNDTDSFNNIYPEVNETFESVVSHDEVKHDSCGLLWFVERPKPFIATNNSVAVDENGFTILSDDSESIALILDDIETITSSDAKETKYMDSKRASLDFNANTSDTLKMSIITEPNVATTSLSIPSFTQPAIQLDVEANCKNRSDNALDIVAEGKLNETKSSTTLLSVMEAAPAATNDTLLIPNEILEGSCITPSSVVSLREYQLQYHFLPIELALATCIHLSQEAPVRDSGLTIASTNRFFVLGINEAT